MFGRRMRNLEDLVVSLHSRVSELESMHQTQNKTLRRLSLQAGKGRDPRLRSPSLDAVLAREEAPPEDDGH